MRLDELFDKDIGDVKFDKFHLVADLHDYSFPFSVNGHKYLVKFVLGKDGYTLQFNGYDYHGYVKYNNLGNMGASAIEVFSKVIQITIKFVEEAKPERIDFDGYKVDNRDKLYRKMIQILKKRYPQINVSETDIRGDEEKEDHIHFTVTF